MAGSLPKKAGLMIWRVLHVLIIVNFLAEIFYVAYMVFFVVAPHGGIGPLGKAAAEFPFETMVTRRLYAIEGWLAIAGLSIYLAITEIAPRFLRSRSPAGQS